MIYKCNNCGDIFELETQDKWSVYCFHCGKKGKLLFHKFEEGEHKLIKQDWKIIQKQLEERGESCEDIKVCKCFYDCDWKVYPEAGHRFQKVRDYREDDEGIELDSISMKEGKELYNRIINMGN